MKYLKVLFALPLIVLAHACTDHSADDADVLPYLKAALDDRNSKEYRMLERNSAENIQGDIIFLGRTRDADIFASRFVEYDEHDNVDGSSKTDNLKDFAGETLCCISENYPTVNPRDSVSVDLFRTKASRTVISALDTVSYVSLYDTYGLGRKNTSKIFLLGSPEHSLWTSDDMAYMSSRTGTLLRAISPLDLSLDKVFSQRKSKPLRLAVIAPGNAADPEIYQELFRLKSEKFAVEDAKCLVMPSSPDSLLYRVLREYSATSDPLPLDAVIVDDISLDLDSLKLQQAEMISVMNESSMTFGRMLSENFDIYDTFEEAVTSLYGMLRQNNLFTHNISQPQVMHLSPVQRSDESGDSLILIPFSYVQN